MLKARGSLLLLLDANSSVLSLEKKPFSVDVGCRTTFVGLLTSRAKTISICLQCWATINTTMAFICNKKSKNQIKIELLMLSLEKKPSYVEFDVLLLLMFVGLVSRFFLSLCGLVSSGAPTCLPTGPCVLATPKLAVLAVLLYCTTLSICGRWVPNYVCWIAN